MLEYTSFALPFIISTLILIYLGIYAYRQRKHVESAGLFSLLTFALVIWSACYGLELSSPALADKILWAKMKYFGAASGPVLWFIFSLHYTKQKHRLTRPLQIGLSAFIIFTLTAVFTNDFHHLYWGEITSLPGFPETQSEQGILFWVYAVGIYSMILASVAVYVNYLSTVPFYFRRQAVLMVLGGFLPLGIRILEDFVGWDPFPKIDNVILFLLVSAILFALALFRYGALEIVPIAHNLIVNNINSGIMVLDAAGRIVEINPFARSLLEDKGADAIGKPFETAMKNFPRIHYTAQSVERSEEEISLERSGQTSFFIAQVSPIRNEQGNLMGHVISLLDITDRKRSEMELERLARTDMLTGIMNRRYFFDLAEIQFAQARRYSRPLAVMMLDVDHFKSINDRYGHLAGDYVLQVVAADTQRYLRSTDIFARYGGEEFICLLPEQNNESTLESAERIRQMIEQVEVKFEAQIIQVTASFGLAILHNEYITLEQLIDRADQALYQSKKAGRNKVTLWEQEGV